ncbi:hypothetical protein GU927_007370 [Rhodobacteraceae bacterium HSP-20]|uniref:Heme peroxidase n=1 Tax=Paragemmobacter amnigenus TaxID=2852097 RepID=A0ABS6J449_9RHOB|nr:peroxidase family protein [Rhodobacter amnigenus]MBU9697664.1 hypothetical protein [Rhodobacter amnigenus]MBV4388891.1 hypothetical protein [Rhodobacter amnigenus]
MVTLNLNDLAHILEQIRIAEQHTALINEWIARESSLPEAERTPLVEIQRQTMEQLISSPLVPYGLRTVTGELNNYQPGYVFNGTSDQAMVRLLQPFYMDAEASPRTGEGTSYAQLSGSVYDSEPRTVSNLVADQSLYNPAAISAALAINGVIGAANLTATQEIYTAVKAALAEAGIVGLPTDSEMKAILTAGGLPPADLSAEPTAAQNLVVTLAANDIQLDGVNVALGNVAADLGDTAPYNSFFTIFGQFFDHGLDLTSKGEAAGTVFIPLQPDDPLYVAGSHTNFMVLTRATNVSVLPGADGQLGTSDDIRDNTNQTTPWIDLNQLYTSNPSHQVFLREFVTGPDGTPVVTGRMLEGQKDGAPTWADVKAQAQNVLGIQLSDMNVHSVPALLTDLYGNFVPGPNGFPQVILTLTFDVPGATEPVQAVIVREGFVIRDADNKVIDSFDPSDVTLESLPTGIVPAGAIGVTADYASAGRAFLNDIAHDATPNANATADADAEISAPGSQSADARGNLTTYDNELLDRHFIVGDGRGNENIALTAIHTIFHSEHNRQIEAVKTSLIAGATTPEGLRLLNEFLVVDVEAAPATGATLVWDGARLFQTARFSTEMVYQHLVFEEFVRSIAPQIDPFVFSNSVEIPVGISQEFAQVVYRFGHSMLNETVDMFGLTQAAGALGIDKMDLFDAFLNPVAFEAQGVDAHDAAGAILLGMTRQHGNEIDEFLTTALRNNLVGLPLDLAALNIARARETGIPSLNEARSQFFEQTGNTYVKPYESWTDFAANIKNPMSVINFIAAYGTHPTILAATTMDAKRDAAIKLVLGGEDAPADRIDFLNAKGDYAGGKLGGLNDVDFWIGGLAEAKMPFGGMLGSTFTFVFEAQMEALQNGDRFYYLSRTQGMNLLTELESDSFADLIRRNTSIEHDGLAINGAAFQTADWVLQVNKAKQWNEGIGDADPTREADVLSAMLGNDKLVERGANYLKYLGGEHVVIGGTNAADTIIGGAGDDGLWGEDGDDVIEGGFGVDHIHGGDGSDIITDSGTDVGAADVLKGQGGDDMINGGMGLDLIFGGDGRDVLAGGDEAKDVFGGQGDDFIRAASGGGGIYYGNEGNDWMEGQGNMNTLTGDNSELFFNSRIIGHDVMLAGENDTDFDAESGDDIMVQGIGINRNNGMAGFDWVTYKGADYVVDADMNVSIFVNQQNNILRDRFDLVEGLSGWKGDDKLTGREVPVGAYDPNFNAAQTTPTSPIESFSNVLLKKNLHLVDGLSDLVAHLDEFQVFNPADLDDAGNVVNPNPITEVGIMDTSDGSDILLGGGGSDVIKGMSGNDIIDGDKWLNVRIEVLDAFGNAFATTDGLTKQVVSLVTGPVIYLGQKFQTVAGQPLFGGMTLEQALFARKVKAADLNVVREILDGDAQDTGEDVAVYWDVMGNYTITNNGDGSFTVTHDNQAVGPVDPATGRALRNEGSDRLTNIEVLRFADMDLRIQNSAPQGGPVISDTTPTETQTLTANLDTLVDGNGFSNGPMLFQWQMSTDAGATWTDIGGATGETFTPTQAQVGSILRVEISYVDGMGYTETVASAQTDVVGDFFFSPADFSGNTRNGTAGADSLTDLTGNNTFNGLAGDDTITGGIGQDTVNGGDGNDLISTGAGADLVNGGAGNDVISTGADADLVNGGAGNDVITGGTGNDVLNGGEGDDTFTYSIANPGLFGITTTDGRDRIDGGTETGVGDTFVLNGNNTSETFTIFTRAAFFAANPLLAQTAIAASTEIVITRNGTNNTSVIAELREIEEIVINSNAQLTANNGDGVLNGGLIAGDTINIQGNFTGTSLNYSTITINGDAGDDTVDISALESAHRIVFRTKGGNDVIVGSLRAQDVIEVPAGSDPASYAAEANGDGTVTLSNGSHSVTFTGSLDDLPVLVSDSGADDGADDGADTGEEEDPDDDNGNDGTEEETEGEGSGTGSGSGSGSGSGTGGGTVTPPPVVEGVVLMPGSTAGVMVGDAGDDVVVGGEQGDALLGKGGADILLGNGGNDVGVGGSGGDTVEGGAGRDVLLGGEGDDLFIAQSGDGADMIFGGAGSDTLDLSALTEGATVDLGAYTPIGTVRTGGVTDHLVGVENVIGSTGADVIKASLGINVMTGADGDDIFVFVSAGTADGDVITDFRPGDRIDLSGIDAVTGTAGNQAFTLAGQGTTAAGSLVIREIATEHGTDTLIEGFTDADEEADFTITLRGAHNLDGSSFNF